MHRKAKEEVMGKTVRPSTRNVVETAIDASKADKTTPWESVAKKLREQPVVSGKSCEKTPEK